MAFITSGTRLDELQFDNTFTRDLPADPNPVNSRRQVLGACYSRVQPTKVAAPRLLAFSREVVELLGMDHGDVETSEFAEVFGGNRVLPGMDPFAMCYGGHQFGNWAGQLGDGRAINLGELVNADGQRWMLQLKGAGPTPYSRTADGLAVLRSSVREFLCSEAMHHLGVPTTRALSLVATGEDVLRDMFYDGNPKREPGAVVCRVAQSFTRFGNFQIFAARKDTENLRRLIDYTLRNDFSHLGEPDDDAVAAWFHEVCRTTAEMVIHWMRVGFVHGVMNTDNMSILGQTIDYGPYGWLEGYDPDWTPNTTDASGRRYRFGHQPQIAMWNLVQLANALAVVVEDHEMLQQGIDLYADHADARWRSMMADKLGWREFNGDHDMDLVSELLKILQLTETDMTIFYRRLADVSVNKESDNCDSDPLATLQEAWYAPGEVDSAYRERFAAWWNKYRARCQRDGFTDTERRSQMNAVNPRYVLRNYLAQLAIDQAENGDPAMIGELLEVLRNPYNDQPGREEFEAKRPEWARHRAGCSMLSCSS